MDSITSEDIREKQITTHEGSGSVCLKVNIGSGGAWAVPGWFGFDQRSTSHTWQESEEPNFIDLDVKKGLPFPTNSVDVVFSSHALEHFTYQEAVALLFEIYRVLKIGSPLCLVVPDLDLYLQNYLNRDEKFLTTAEIIGGIPRGNLADNLLMNFYSDPKFNNTCHKYAYNLENLSSTLKFIGFDQIEKVTFHEFSYCPELNEGKFKSRVPSADLFSLSVQCRKVSFDPQYRDRVEYKEAHTYSRFSATEHELSRQLNASQLLRNKLHEELTTIIKELNDSTSASSALAQRIEALDLRNRELEADAVRVHDELLEEKRSSVALLGQIEAERLASEGLENSRLACAEELIELRRLLAQEISHRRSEIDEVTNRAESSKQAFEAITLARLQDQARNAELRTKRLHAKRQIFESMSGCSTGDESLLQGLRQQVGRKVFPQRRAGEKELILHSGLFDPVWYSSRNPDLAAHEGDALDHYLRRGAREGRDPNPLFVARWYLHSDPEIGKAGLNPLVHYIKYGAAEGREPNALFDTRWYVSRFVEDGQIPKNPLGHFLRTWMTTSVDPNPLFDRDWYKQHTSGVRELALSPFAHFVQFGEGEARSPHPLFDTEWYLAEYPDAIKADTTVGHFLRFGKVEGRNPNPYFDTKWYLAEYPDAAESDLNPLVHYLQIGAAKGYDPGPRFGTAAYLRRYPDVAQAGTNPLAHYLQFGLAEGRNPSRDAHFAHRGSIKEQNPETVADPSLSRAMKLSASRAGDVTVSETLYSPLISILVPTFDTPPRYLREVLQSVKAQTYSNWELCLVDDGSKSTDCLNILKEVAGSDPRLHIHFSSCNEGIARSSQRALDMASGEFVGFLDHDDILASNALAEAVQLLRHEPTLDMIYTDHAMIDDRGAILSVSLKPGWSPEFFLSTNYIVHFKVVRRSVLTQVGGFTSTLHAAQDIGLTCKLVERGATVRHLPKVLYFWRTHSGSVASGTTAKPAIEAAALQTYNDSLHRRGVSAVLKWPEVFQLRKSGAYKVDFPQLGGRKVAIVIPALDNKMPEDGCLALTEELATYDVFQTHLVTAEENSLLVHPSCRLHIARDQESFNSVVSRVDCELLVFLSPTSMPLTRTWFSELLGYLAISSDVGAVGGKVLNEFLKVRSGGYLLLNKPFTICEGQADESDGYWLNGRIASNVEAVSSRLLATPKAIYQEAGGIPFFEFRDAAGLPYCLRLRGMGKRVVYNPWSKIVDVSPDRSPSTTADKLLARFGTTVQDDRYYHPFFSRTEPYRPV